MEDTTELRRRDGKTYISNGIDSDAVERAEDHNRAVQYDEQDIRYRMKYGEKFIDEYITIQPIFPEGMVVTFIEEIPPTGEIIGKCYKTTTGKRVKVIHQFNNLTDNLIVKACDEPDIVSTTAVNKVAEAKNLPQDVANLMKKFGGKKRKTNKRNKRNKRKTNKRRYK